MERDTSPFISRWPREKIWTRGSWNARILLSLLSLFSFARRSRSYASSPCVTRARTYAARQIARALSIGNIERVCVRASRRAFQPRRGNARTRASSLSVFPARFWIRERVVERTPPSAASRSRAIARIRCLGIARTNIGEVSASAISRVIKIHGVSDFRYSTRASARQTATGGVRSAFHRVRTKVFLGDAEESQTLIYAIFDARTRRSRTRSSASARERVHACARLDGRGYGLTIPPPLRALTLARAAGWDGREGGNEREVRAVTGGAAERASERAGKEERARGMMYQPRGGRVREKERGRVS